MLKRKKKGEETDVQFHLRLRQTLRCIGDIFRIQFVFDPILSVALPQTIDQLMMIMIHFP